MNSANLSSLPEELLERILDDSIHTPGPRNSNFQHNRQPSSPASPLLASRTFNRIATPLLYNDIHLKSAAQTDSLLDALGLDPSLGASVKTLTADGLYKNLGAVIEYLSDLSTLDFCFDSVNCKPRPCQVPGGSVIDPGEIQFHSFCAALHSRTSIRRLSIRKAPQIYLTNPVVRLTFERLAISIRNWRLLEHIYLAFRMSDDTQAPRAAPGMPPSAAPGLAGPLRQLTSSLATLPNLRTFATHLPSVWNTTLTGLTGESLDDSSPHSDPNSYATVTSRGSLSLERIVLLPGAGPDQGHSVGSSAHFDRAHSGGSPAYGFHGHAQPSAIPSSLGRARSLNTGTGYVSNPLPPSYYPSAGCPPGGMPDPGGLYLAGARRYPRLMQLIKNGWSAQVDRPSSPFRMGSPAPGPMRVGSPMPGPSRVGSPMPGLSRVGSPMPGPSRVGSPSPMGMYPSLRQGGPGDGGGRGRASTWAFTGPGH